MKRILAFVCLCAVPLYAQPDLEKAIETQVKKAGAAVTQSAADKKARVREQAQEKEFSAFIKDLQSLCAADFMTKYSIYNPYGVNHFHYYSAYTGSHNARLHRFLKEELSRAGTYQNLAAKYAKNEYMLPVIAEMYLRGKGMTDVFSDYQYRLFGMGFKDRALNDHPLRGQAAAAEVLSAVMPDYINKLNQQLAYSTSERALIRAAAEPLFKFYEIAVQADKSSFLHKNRRYIQDSVMTFLIEVLQSGNETRIDYYLKRANPLVRHFTFDEAAGHVSAGELLQAYESAGKIMPRYNKNMADLRLALIQSGVLEPSAAQPAHNPYLKGMRSIL